MWFLNKHCLPFLAPLVLAIALLTSGGAAVLAQTASAGLVIRNTATATYFNARLGTVETVTSNTVSATVAAIPAFEVAGNSALVLARGATAFHQYQVTNVGNISLNMVFDVTDSGTPGVIGAQRLHIDNNGNGVIDATDPQIAFGASVLLPVGGSIDLIYAFGVSPMAAAGDSVMSELAASGKSAAGTAQATGHGQGLGSVQVVEATLKLEKKARQAESAKGTLITYALRLYNNSQRAVAAYGTVGGIPVMIDGAPARGVLVRDAIPLNTRLVTAGTAASLTTLYHLQGTPRQTYVTQPPKDASRVDAVAFFHPGDYPMGQFREVSFTVLRPLPLAAAEVLNTAETFVITPSGGLAVPSNEVKLPASGAAAVLLEFTDPLTGDAAGYGETGTDTALRAVSGACNTTHGIDRVQIGVTSGLTGDAETVAGVETGPNTGIFTTAPLPVAKMLNPVAGDGVIASANGDVLAGTVACGGLSAAAELLVAPGLYFFDSVTNAAIAGAVVELRDPAGIAIASATTAADGFAALGQAAAGSYTLHVLPPPDYSFPSVRLGFGGYGRQVDAQASYGLAFSHAGGPVGMVDIPLDPFYGVPLALEKSANKTKVQAGEFVLYTLTATNNMSQALLRGQITDRLPPNAVLVAGSARLDGRVIAAPEAGGAGTLIFDAGTIEPLASVTLEYVIRFTPTTKSGDRINEAVLSGQQAGTGQVRVSNTARARVRLNAEGGVFSREGTIIGTVFLDCNENGIMDGASELGVPGVRIVTQQGLAVVTDRDGKYSLFGLKPVGHVLALQSATLPVNAKPRVSRAADMLQAGSRLVALKRGELRAEMFPLKGCSAAAFAEIARRTEALADRDGADANLLSDLPIGAGSPDARSARSEAGLATRTQVYGSRTPDAPAEAGAQAADSGTQPRTLEMIIKELAPGFGFMELQDGGAVRRRSLKLRVKGPADLTLRLEVNGREIGGSRVGEHAVWEGGNLQAKEYVALRLIPGPNKLRLTGTDAFGITRKSAEITITAPGDPARIEIIAPPEAAASPGSAVPVVVRILDARGNPAQAASVVTLEARSGKWDVTDIRDDQPGVQAYIDNGEATFDLLAPQNAGPETVKVRSSFGSDSARILFKPDLADRILVGIIEGSVGLKNGKFGTSGDMLSPFEDTVSGLRGELYLKGRIRGDALLTLRYSSDRDTEDRLFRDIRADEYYPVYGDSSERGFDAQSSARLFVKVEKGASYILYGDIAIEPGDPAFKLGGYRDVTTGVKAHWEGENARVTVFAARTAQQSRTVEIPGRGISGPYDIDLSNFREGTDTVEILVRDEDTGEVISAQRLRRLIDYTLDYFRNTIIFDYPVRQADAEGNPVSVRVTYQIEGKGAEAYWLYGAEGVLELSERTRIGARTVRSDGPDGSSERFSVDAVFAERQLGENARIEAEIARASDGQGQEGGAARLTYAYQTADRRFQLEASAASEDFAPPGSPVRAGTSQVKLTYETRLTDTASLSAGAEYTIDRVQDTEQLRADVGLRRRVSETLTRTDGLRWSRDLHKGAEEDARVLLLQTAEWRPASTPGLKFDFDLEMPLTGAGQGSFLIGGEYAPRDGLRFYGLAEMSLGPAGDALTRAQFGAEYRLSDWLTGRSELTSARDQAARAVQGFDGKWELNERVSLRAGLEHSFDIGVLDSGLTSLALGAKWASEDGRWIGEAALDQTYEAEGYTAYSDLGLAGQITPDLSVLARSRFAYDARGDGPERIRHRLRAGLAYRPKSQARLNILAWYENRLEIENARSLDHLWMVSGTWDASPRLRLNGKYAGQYSAQGYDNGSEASGLMQLVQAGVTGEVIPDRLEASLNAYHMWDSSGYSSQALGLEAGFVIDEGVMISLGYNHARETQPFGSPFYEDGLYLKLRLKLDESLWDQLGRFLGG